MWARPIAVLLFLSLCTLAHSQSLNLDAMCKAQAEKEFHKTWNEKEASYTNHYTLGSKSASCW